MKEATEGEKNHMAEREVDDAEKFCCLGSRVDSRGGVEEGIKRRI